MTKDLAAPENAEMGDCIFIKPDVLVSYQKEAPNFPNKSTRPFCLVIADPKREGILWAVPITSSSLDKYKSRARRSPWKYRFYQLKGNENCFNLSQMFPIIQSDIKNVYILKGKKVQINKTDFYDLNRTVSSILQKEGMLSHVSNIQAPTLLQMAERRLQMEQEHSRANSLAQQPDKAEEKQMSPKMKLQAQLAEKKKNELHLHR